MSLSKPGPRPTIQFVTLNKEIVKAAGKQKAKKKHPLSVLVDQQWPNVILCGKKFKGKTTVLFHFLKKFANKDTSIVVFCPTVFRDDAWKEITEWCDKHGFDIIKRTDFEMSPEEKEQREDGETNFLKGVVKALTEEEEPDLRNYCFLFDDMSEELRVPIMRDLMKKNRHYHGLIIISMHDWFDLYPAARKQANNVLLFGGVDRHTIRRIHRELQLGIPVDQLIRAYDVVVGNKEDPNYPHNFLYIDADNDMLRKNFNEGIPVDTSVYEDPGDEESRHVRKKRRVSA